MLNILTITGGTISTNSYIIEKNNEIIIFDFVPEIEKVIKEKKYLLNSIFLTHIHYDHFEMLFKFQENYDFTLYLSNFAYKNINNSFHNLLGFLPEEINLWVKDIDLSKAKIVKDNDIILWNDIEIRIIEAPGHSIDSLIYVIDKEKIAFVGDTIFCESIGRTDLPDSNPDKIFESINKFFKSVTDDYTLYPGHGESTTVLNEKLYNYFLKGKLH